MKITEVRIRKMDNADKLKAFAEVTFDDAFVVHDIKVIEGEKGMFISFPARKGNDEKFHDICHPIKSEMRSEIESAVLKAYEDA